MVHVFRRKRTLATASNDDRIISLFLDESRAVTIPNKIVSTVAEYTNTICSQSHGTIQFSFWRKNDHTIFTIDQNVIYTIQSKNISIRHRMSAVINTEKFREEKPQQQTIPNQRQKKTNAPPREYLFEYQPANE